MRKLVKDSKEITVDEVINKVTDKDNFIEILAVEDGEVYTLRRATGDLDMPPEFWDFIFTKVGTPLFALERNPKSLTKCLTEPVYGDPDIFIFEDKDEYLDFLRDNL